MVYLAMLFQTAGVPAGPLSAQLRPFPCPLFGNPLPLLQVADCCVFTVMCAQAAEKIGIKDDEPLPGQGGPAQTPKQ